MDITWHGHSCFTFKGSDATIVTDPYTIGNKLPKLKANIVTLGDVLAEKEGEISQVEGNPKVLDWPGEFEVSNVAVEAFSADQFAKEGSLEGENVNIFVFMLDGIKICHLSGLAHELSDELLDRIGDVDILLIPVGGGVVLDGKKAQNIVEAIEPRIVIPMYFNATETKLQIGGAEEFLKTMGQTELQGENKFTIKGRSNLPDDVMTFVLLEPVA